jgi:translocation and assembly module TamB
MRGTTRLGAGSPLDVRLQAPTVNLAMLGPFIPAVKQSAGTLSCDLHVTGTLQQPQVDGNLALRDGALELAATGEPYKGIQARITLAGDRITVEQLQLESHSGPLQVTGWIEHTGLTPRRIDLAVSARNFTAMHSPSIETMVSAQVTVRGTLQETIVAGSVTVPQAHIHIDKIPGSGPKTVQPWELTLAGVYGPGPTAVAKSKEPTQVPTWYDLRLPFVRADIQVELPRNVWLQGSGTAIELSGQMRVTKALSQPFVLSGSVATVRGFATYYSKRFAVQSGQVTFTGTPELNPLLDVTVVQKVSEYVVSIHVTGKAQEPTITFSSTPELSQADIVSLLVIGKTTDRLTKSERNALGNEAQQLAGGLLASQLENRLGSALGLDTLDISAGAQLGSGSVRLGRYVTQDLFLSLEQGLGQAGSATTSSSTTSSGTTSNGTTIGLEYSLNRHLKVRGSSSDQGATAVDFLWRLDY